MQGTVEVVAIGSEVVHRVITDGMSMETCFKLASVGKQFTAILVLSLITDGLISIKDQVGKFIPELEWSQSCIFHLLAHTSDIEDVYERVNEDVEYTNQDLLALLQTNGLQPGERYIYSNTGYDILAVVVEKVTEQPFHVYLRQRLLDEAGMTHTFTVHDVNRVGDVVSSFCQATGEEYTYNHLNKIVGSGGICSCATDLIKWNMCMNHLVYSMLLDLAHLQITPSYGLGFEVYPDHVAHSGCWEGFNTYLAFYPESQTSVIVLSNLDETDAEAIGKGLHSSQSG